MEEKGIVLQELSCRTAAKLPPPDCRRSFSGSMAAVKAVKAVRPPSKLRQQSASVLRELNCGRSFSAAPAGVLRELNYRRSWQVRQG